MGHRCGGDRLGTGRKPGEEEEEEENDEGGRE